MATRTAGGRIGAASALVMLVAWAFSAGVGTARAQQFAGREDFRFADDNSLASQEGLQLQEGFQPSEVPDYGDPAWGTCRYECGDACDDYHLPETDVLGGCCGGGRQWWIGADYLLWQLQGVKLPPLVTDHAVALIPIEGLPVLGATGTSVIAGDNVIGESWRSGYRLRAGVWLDACRDLAITGDYFHLGDDDYNFYYPGNTGRNTGRPFFNAETGLQDVRLISGPNTIVDGSVAVNTDDDFQGAGLDLEHTVYAIGDISGYGPGTQVILIGGYRYYSYNSQLAISDRVTTLSGADAGLQTMKRDDFSTRNEFHGGEFGGLVRFTQQGCWFDGMIKIAVGGQRNSATIGGETVTIPAGMAAQSAEGGLLTSSETNIGNFSSTRARVIPEFRLGVGAYLTPNWTVNAGYSAIVWSGVARAAQLMPPNLAVDPRNTPPVSAGGGASPLFPGLGGSDLLAHGLDLGVQYTY